MLDLMDETIEAFFRGYVPLSATDVDVAFDPPDRQWSARLSRPTINAFLWDIRRSSARARTGLEEVEQDGRMIRRLALPVVELRYIATVWTPDHSDERSLLGELTRCLLKYSVLPADVLASDIADLRPPSLTVGRAGETQPDIFRALDGQLRAGINFTVSVEVDTERKRAKPLAKEPSGVSVAVGWTPSANGNGAEDVPQQRHPAGGRLVAGEVAGDEAVGELVRSPTDAAVVNSAGQFLIRASAGDEIVLMTKNERRVKVPDEGGVRIE